MLCKTAYDAKSRHHGVPQPVCKLLNQSPPRRRASADPLARKRFNASSGALRGNSIEELKSIGHG
jgi:hypothetical protein